MATKFYHRHSSVMLSAVLVLVFASCRERTNSDTYLNISGFTQGTTYSITYSDSLSRNFSIQIDSIFALVDSSMSVFNSSSAISKINRNEQMHVNSLLADVLQISRSISDQTEGAFDITIGSITRAVGFAGGTSSGIDTAKVLSLLRFVGMDKFYVEDNKLVKLHPDVVFDLNAVAQGYTSDLIASFLTSRGVGSYMVEVGGEIVATGVNPNGTAWVIGVDKPEAGGVPGEDIQAKIMLTGGQGLATSGNYRKFVEVDGQKYSHTINPKTGLPVLNSLLSATVVAPSGAIADALGTAFMVKGLEWSMSFVKNHPNIDAYLIYSDSTSNFCVWQSDGLKLLPN